MARKSDKGPMQVKLMKGYFMDLGGDMPEKIPKGTILELPHAEAMAALENGVAEMPNPATDFKEDGNPVQPYDYVYENAPKNFTPEQREGAIGPQTVR